MSQWQVALANSFPVPDFYGEKIQSVTGYRRWLKDQKAFNKKKTAKFV
jgi:import inner membrane translocase subunit TIM23